MATNILRDAVLVGAIAMAGVFAFNNRPLIYDLVGIHPEDFKKDETPLVKQRPVETMPATTALGGSAASIRKTPDGHFWTDARVNSTTIKFLVDTGASVVALTPEDALKAGFRLNDLRYTSPVNTASGQVMAAPIDLKLVSISNVRVRNVRAVVIPEGLPHSLLGMSYLGELQRVEATKSSLILRQ